MSAEQMGMPDEVAQKLETAKAGDPKINKLTRGNIDIAREVAWYSYAAREVAMYDYHKVDIDRTPRPADRQTLARIALGNFSIANARAERAAWNYLLPPSLVDRLRQTQIGDPDLNQRTYDDHDLAEAVATATKTAYEAGLEYVERLGQPIYDYEDRKQLANLAISRFALSNARAAAAATELAA